MQKQGILKSLNVSLINSNFLRILRIFKCIIDRLILFVLLYDESPGFSETPPDNLSPP